MKANRVRGASWGMALVMGIGVGACHDAPSNANSEHQVRARGSAIPSGAVSASDEGAKASAGGAGPVPRAVLPDGVTRRPAEGVPGSDLRAAVNANNQFATALFGALRSESLR